MNSAKVREGLQFIINVANSLLGHMDAQEDITIIAAERLHKLNAQILIPPHKESKPNVTAPEDKQMPPKYADGCFRRRGKSLEYRFFYKGQQHSLYGKTEQDCFNKRTKILEGKTILSDKKQLTLAAWLDTWYNIYKMPRCNQQTKKLTERHIKYIKNEVKDKPLNKITELTLQEILNKFADRPNTQKKIAYLIRAVFRKAVSNKKISFNPAAEIETIYHKDKHFPVLQPEQQSLILENIDAPKYRRLFFFCCCTGLRPSEALKRKTADVDFNNNVLHITEPDTRTKKHKRIVPILPELIELRDTEMLFPDITLSGVQTYFKRLYKKLGIRGVLYSFRHTFISCCYHVGFRDVQIKEYAGHSKIQMTLDTYTHILKNQNSPVIEYLKRLKSHVDLN